ncbi:DgyrCDS2222 [Dimorphilus gyrociliatus]|uniref:DgyrCDS2222 n=1 Tax=Dimorphilus gyrociliatus TaxID=2664684 RepID=A0A7I8V9T3_9ANNE|nr:DgyrCDS2222 [Dimorphilus gyrociliatus]
MSVAIVCMVNHTAIKQSSEANASTLNSSLCPGLSVNESNPTKDGPFEYDKPQQGHILGGFFYGYLISQIPGGILAEKFGGKKVFLIFSSISTLATILTPIGAHLGFGYLIALRVLVGFGSGAAFPTMHAVWGKWAPPLERSKLVSVSYGGAMMGSVLALPLSGALCEYGYAGGWPSIFYTTGITTIIFLIIWLLFVSDTPQKHKLITEDEKFYISNSLKGQVSEKSNKGKTPWFEFLKSRAVWAICVANFTSDWGLYTFLTNIPTFLHEVLKFDIESNGLFSALPWIGLWINMTISPIIADKLISTSKLSVQNTRKLMNSIGGIGSAACLVGVAFTDCRSYFLAIALLTLGVTLSGSHYSGFLVNHMDIAPKYAGTLFGISNMIGSISGFVAPTLVGIITKDQTKAQWMIVFFLSAGVLVFGSVVFIIFGRGDLQKWAEEKEDKKPDIELKTML